MRPWHLLAFAPLLACSSGAEETRDEAAQRADLPADAGDAGPAPGSKAANCASTFGTELVAPFGRLDGTVLAVIDPGYEPCPRPNRSHVILQVTSGGAAYRMVINVVSTFEGVSPDVRFAEVGAPLPAPAWSEGWHAAARLGYPDTLGVHSTDPRFVAYPFVDLARRVVDAIPLGAKVSVYSATSGGDSAHKIHRNGGSRPEDGAIVIDADGTSPRWLLFHFSNQSF